MNLSDSGRTQWILVDLAYMSINVDIYIGESNWILMSRKVVFYRLPSECSSTAGCLGGLEQVEGQDCRFCGFQTRSCKRHREGERE